MFEKIKKFNLNFVWLKKFRLFDAVKRYVTVIIEFINDIKDEVESIVKEIKDLKKDIEKIKKRKR